mgnify:CR=1 FL=1
MATCRRPVQPVRGWWAGPGLHAAANAVPDAAAANAVLAGTTCASTQYLRSGLVRKADLLHYMQKHKLGHRFPRTVAADIEDEEDIDVDEDDEDDDEEDDEVLVHKEYRTTMAVRGRASG